MRAIYDAVLIVSFGGPEGPEDVIPFLENVLRGKNVPRERLLEVAEHYRHFNGVSPLNAQNRVLIAALEAVLETQGPQLPIYWGNRNWHPLVESTIAQMNRDGIRRAIAFVTSAYSSYSGCRQYREDIQRAQQAAGADALVVEKLRAFYNHPGFVGPMGESVATALDQVPAARRPAAALVYTAHSIPVAMAERSAYVAQLEEASRLVSQIVGRDDWQLVFQSRSGPPTQAWLEPDIGDYLRDLAARGVQDVVVVPIGFLSDHMEVLYDLDTEAQHLSRELGINMIRAATVGAHPQFVQMIRDLIVERMTPGTDRPALGMHGPSHDVCPADCCLPLAPRAQTPR